jgi:hypothetical protein
LVFFIILYHHSSCCCVVVIVFAHLNNYDKMNQLPASIAPLLSSIVPAPAPTPTSTAANTAAANSTGAAAVPSKMLVNQSQLNRSKLQNVPAFLNKLYK